MFAERACRGTTPVKWPAAASIYDGAGQRGKIGLTLGIDRVRQSVAGGSGRDGSVFTVMNRVNALEFPGGGHQAAGILHPSARSGQYPAVRSGEFRVVSPWWSVHGGQLMVYRLAHVVVRRA